MSKAKTLITKSSKVLAATGKTRKPAAPAPAKAAPRKKGC